MLRKRPGKRGLAPLSGPGATGPESVVENGTNTELPSLVDSAGLYFIYPYLIISNGPDDFALIGLVRTRIFLIIDIPSLGLGVGNKLVQGVDLQ